MADSVFTVSGLATGMDTASMVDKLVQLESRPLTMLQSRETAFKAQVSALGDISSRLAALKTATDGLASGGVLEFKTASTNTAFAATPGSRAVAGSFDVQVTALATQAKMRSAAFGAGDTVQGGTLTVGTPGGTPVAPITIPDGATLADVADAIRSSGAPVSAVVLNDDLGSHLSITSLATGSASTLTFAPKNGATGTKSLGLTTAAGTDSSFTLDGLPFTRSSNVVTDALPGTTLQLKAAGGARETLEIQADPDATAANLKTFADAYNGVMQLIQKQLNVAPSTDRASTLAGDASVRLLQSGLEAIGASVVRQGAVRSLADLGLKTQRDGTLSVDAAGVAAAIARDPAGVGAIFSDASAGIAKLTTSLVSSFTGPDGLLGKRQDSLQDQIRQMDAQAIDMQTNLDDYRQRLVEQFTTMETVVSQYKSIGTFLSQQSITSSK